MNEINEILTDIKVELSMLNQKLKGVDELLQENRKETAYNKQQIDRAKGAITLISILFPFFGGVISYLFHK